jgi:hypothetical protein
MGRRGSVEGARRLRAGDEEAAGGGVLAGVVHRTGADVVVHPLVRRHHVAGVVLVPLHPLLHVAPFRRAPVVVPAGARAPPRMSCVTVSEMASCCNIAKCAYYLVLLLAS